MSDALVPAVIAAGSALAGAGITQLVNYLMEARKARLQADTIRWSKSIDWVADYVIAQNQAIDATRDCHRVYLAPDPVEVAAWRRAYEEGTKLLIILPDGADAKAHNFLQGCLVWRKLCYQREELKEGSPNLEKFIDDLRPYIRRLSPQAKLGYPPFREHEHGADPRGKRYSDKASSDAQAGAKEVR